MQPLLAFQTESLPSHCTGFLEIDTKAIAHNYRSLQALLPNSLCAAVLKADAYGFGISAIAPILEKEGCAVFFVAHLEEGVFLRSLLKDAQIYVLSGILLGTESLFVEHRLTPVLNDINMVKNWVLKAQQQKKKLSCALHFDTGMHRSGFDQKETIQLFNTCDLLDTVKVDCVMSHLSSSHDRLSPLNEKQRNLFDDLRHRFPTAKASLADTGGIYLDASYHYDIARPGKGLFGLYKAPNLIPCLKLFARVLQIRNASQGESVGYGATHTLSRDSKLATLGIGFADGYDRRLSNKGAALIQGFKAPVIGRISMDYTVIDVTDVPESLCFTGGWVELVNELFTLDHLAESIETISRELSTGFGHRLQRVYK
jgi:alanine racemase